MCVGDCHNRGTSLVDHEVHQNFAGGADAFSVLDYICIKVDNDHIFRREELAVHTGRSDHNIICLRVPHGKVAGFVLAQTVPLCALGYCYDSFFQFF